VYVFMCFNQRRELMDLVCLWEQQHDHWCFDGRVQSRRHSTVLSVTRNPFHLQRTQPQWMRWLPDTATRSQCGLLAGRVLSVITSPALTLLVCLNVSLCPTFICLFVVWPDVDITVLFFYGMINVDKINCAGMQQWWRCGVVVFTARWVCPSGFHTGQYPVPCLVHWTVQPLVGSWWRHQRAF